MFNRENLRSLIIIIGTTILSIIGIQFVPPPPPKPPTPPTPPTEPIPPPVPPVQIDPLNAIGKCSRSGVGCSFTVVGPRRVDGKYDILTAAHCTERVGEQWTARLHNGTTFGFKIVNINRTSDYAWGVTDGNNQALPMTYLAAVMPPVGTKIWHAGFGVDVPGNREDGTVTQLANTDGQVEYELSVSPGDSGGGIMYDSAGHVLSPVCCTTRLGGRGRVWGAGPEASARGRVVMVDLEEWIPIQMPTRPMDFPVKMPGKP